MLDSVVALLDHVEVDAFRSFLWLFSVMYGSVRVLPVIDDCVLHFQFFLAPPEFCPIPRWYSGKFTEVYDAFSLVVRQMPLNVRILPLYQTDPSMFDLDGRHLKSYCGKDYLDHLLNHCDSGMVQAALDADARMAAVENRVTHVDNRVDLLRRDLGRSDQRINVVVARAAEDTDCVQNER